jgi:hypothetical protein
LKKSLIILLIAATSCSTFFKKKSERVLARVYDDYLYESDIKGIVTPGTPARDSLVITRSYIDNWIRQRLILQQAGKNLAKEQLDFTRQLEDYKNSLTIYAYENALVRQKLDTLVTDEETQNYYDANQQNFQLKDNIVQVQYVKLPLKSPFARQVKKLLNSDGQEERSRLADLCEKEAADYFLDDQNWLLFNDLLRQIPIKTYNQEDFLKNHRDLEYQDSSYLYLVRFRDFKIKESISPLSFEKQRIREIILNKRRIEMINRMQDDLYDNARKKNVFEIY